MDCTKAITIQNYVWPNLRDDIRTHIRFCKNYHKNKEKSLKYGNLPSKEAEAIPWDIFLVDLITPHKIRREGHDGPLIIKVLTMAYPETGWFEMVQ